VSAPDSKRGSKIESGIDELYQQPLEAFTSARNALAKTLSAADAAHVRKLVKPTVVPWAVNQLYWRERQVLDRLRKSGGRLRTAQIAALKGRAADLRAASEAHRKAIAEAASEASRIAASAGSHPAADELTRTLEALSLAPEWPETPGRLTRPLQPAGFEALSGIPVANAATGPPRAAGTATRREDPKEKEKQESDRQQKERLKEEREAARRAEAEAGKAEAARDRAAAAEAQARAAWERAKRELDSAERALEKARSRT
jgi:hypothetical protein